MGLAASQARAIMLENRISDLEFGQQVICQQKMALALSTDALTQQQTAIMNQKLSTQGNQASQYDFASDTDQIKLSLALKQIEMHEKVLDTKSQQIDTQVKAFETELEAVKKELDYATGEKSSFGMGAGGRG